MRPKSIAVIVVAAGKGERASTGEASGPKQYRAIGGVPILARSIAAFLDRPEIDLVLPVIHADHTALYAALGLSGERLLAPVSGGDTRQASVLAGLQALQQEREMLLESMEGQRQKLASLEAEQCRLRAEHSATLGHLEQVLASRSWRVTAPLRHCGEWVGKMRTKPI